MGGGEGELTYNHDLLMKCICQIMLSYFKFGIAPLSKCCCMCKDILVLCHTCGRFYIKHGGHFETVVRATIRFVCLCNRRN